MAMSIIYLLSRILFWLALSTKMTIKDWQSWIIFITIIISDLALIEG